MCDEYLLDINHEKDKSIFTAPQLSDIQKRDSDLKIGDTTKTLQFFSAFEIKTKQKNK